MSTTETDREKAERWCREAEQYKKAMWAAEARNKQYLEVIAGVRREADKADRRNQDVSPAALFWIIREVNV